AGLLPVQFSGRSHTFTLGRHTVVAGSSSFGGHWSLSPSHVSSRSHRSLAGRQIAPAGWPVQSPPAALTGGVPKRPLAVTPVANVRVRKFPNWAFSLKAPRSG